MSRDSDFNGFGQEIDLYFMVNNRCTRLVNGNCAVQMKQRVTRVMQSGQAPACFAAKCCNYTATAHSLSLSSSNFLYLLLFSKLLEINHALTLIFILPFPRFTQLVVVFLLLSHAFFFILLLPILVLLH